MLPDDEFEREHPSYGLVSISRITEEPARRASSDLRSRITTE